MNCIEIKGVVGNILRKVMEEGYFPQNDDEDIRKQLNSLRFVMLIVEIENQFNIEIKEDDFDMEKMQSIEAISRLIEKYTSNKVSM